MSVPTWRVRQLQDIEHAAREAVEILRSPHGARSAQEAEALAVLEDALGDE